MQHVIEECDLTSSKESIRDFTRWLREVNVPSRRIDLLRGHRGNVLDQLFGVGALAHRGLLPVRGFVREKPLAFPALHLSAREGCPGRCVTLFCASSWKHGPRLQWLNSGSSQQIVSLARGGLCTSPSSTFQGYETALEQDQRVYRQRSG